MTTSHTSAFWHGFWAGLPFVLVVGPFGLLFGVVATEAGLDIVQTMGFSILVIAGASQFAALQLMLDNAPTVIVLTTALAVNLRMAMYSASLVPHLGQAPLWQRAIASYFLVDQSYAVSQPYYEARPDLSMRQKLAFFAGSMTPVAPVWYLSTLLGAVMGQQIPPEFALDFAVPITFLALVAPGLKSLPHVLAALTSILLALAFAWVPYSLGLIIAAAAAMAVGAGSELYFEKRAQA
ncbi:MAG: AzlC family ABC transporter permease [Mangrovicoccus sp.]